MTRQRKLSLARRRLQAARDRLDEPTFFGPMPVILILCIIAISVYGVGFMTVSDTDEKGTPFNASQVEQPVSAAKFADQVRSMPVTTTHIQDSNKAPFCEVGQLVSIIDFRKPISGQGREVPRIYRQIVEQLPRVTVYYIELDYRATVFARTDDLVMIGPKLVDAMEEERLMCLILDPNKRNKIGIFLHPKYF